MLDLKSIVVPKDTVIKMQVGHNDFVDSNGDTLWFNPDGSSLDDEPSGTEVCKFLSVNCK